MCCSCGGADSRARHCTGETNGPSLKWQIPPNCHCEERSDVAISGRHSQIVQAAVKTYRPIASVAALTERLVQGYSTAQGHWCTARHPDVSLRGAKRRGNLGKALAGKLSAKSQLPPRDCHVGLRPPRNDKLLVFTFYRQSLRDDSAAWGVEDAAPLQCAGSHPARLGRRMVRTISRSVSSCFVSAWIPALRTSSRL